MTVVLYITENIMRLHDYARTNIWKKILEREKISQKSLKNFYSISSCLWWIHVSTIVNFYFFTRMTCSINAFSHNFNWNKNLISRLSLLKFRKEFLNKPSQKMYPKKFCPKFTEEKCTSINSLIVFPINKMFFSKKINIRLFIALNNKKAYEFHFTNFIMASIHKKLAFFCLKIFQFAIVKKNFEPISIRTKSTTINKIDLFCKTFLNSNGIASLISFCRNFYGGNTLSMFITLGFLKIKTIRHFSPRKKIPRKSSITIKPHNRSVNFNPLLIPWFRIDLNKNFIFSKLLSSPFEILPSKLKIPLKIGLELKKYLEFHKKKIKVVKNNEFFFSTTHNKTYRKNPERNDRKVMSWNEKKKKICHKFDQNCVQKLRFAFLLIKKANDFPNEEFAAAQLSQYDKIFRENQLDIWMNPLLVQSSKLGNGLMEIIPNSISLHDLKKRIFRNNAIRPHQKKNSDKFIESLVGYSLLCFFLQIKDRHNANIMINSDNRHMHIDFGFILGDYPGNIQFEANSFKLSSTFILEIGGKKTEGYDCFKELFIRGFFSIRKNFGKIFRIARKSIFTSVDSYLKKNKLSQFQKRTQMSKKDVFLIKLILVLIEESAENWKTHQYDRYQLHASGIN